MMHPKKSPWLYALKPASWPKLLVPVMLGQCLGAVEQKAFHLGALMLGLMFVGALTGYIVLLNDWGDRKVDQIKRTMFPQGSKKTIPDRMLSASSVLAAGLMCGVAAVIVSFAASYALARPALRFAGLGCVLVFWAYTFPPLKLNYRGGGELLEALGVGVVLPWWNIYAQSGIIKPRTWSYLVGFSLLCLASAIASGLSDEKSDIRGDKRTFTTQFGNPWARKAILWIVEVSIFALLLSVRSIWISLVEVAPALLWLTYHQRRMAKISPSAVTNAFGPQRAFKQHLHWGIWGSTLIFCAFIMFQRFVW